MKTTQTPAVAAVRTVGVANPARTEALDNIAQLIANDLGVEVMHVAPVTHADRLNKNGNRAKTGFRGLMFNLADGTQAKLEFSLATAPLAEGDFRVEAITDPEL